MRVTDKQAVAVQFVHSNPGASVADIAAAAGASTSGSNDAEFLRRLIDAGLVQVVCTTDVRAVLDNDADDNLGEAALALHDYFTKD